MNGKIYLDCPGRICSETHPQVFQYKLINRFFPCNYTLSNWYSNIKIYVSTVIQQSDTLVHYIVYCTNVAMFCKQFREHKENIVKFWFPLSEPDTLFGIQNGT